jgi:hypothetical protein
MAEVRVDAIKVGDWIDRDPYYGQVDEIHPHGRKIGDGTVDWFTFRVRQPGRAHVGLLSFTDAMGPMRADDTLTVVEPADTSAFIEHPHRREVDSANPSGTTRGGGQ